MTKKILSYMILSYLEKLVLKYFLLDVKWTLLAIIWLCHSVWITDIFLLKSRKHPHLRFTKKKKKFFESQRFNGNIEKCRFFWVGVSKIKLTVRPSLKQWNTFLSRKQHHNFESINKKKKKKISDHTEPLFSVVLNFRKCKSVEIY